MNTFKFLFFLVILASCTSDNVLRVENEGITVEKDSLTNTIDTIDMETDVIHTSNDTIKQYLALGDSYTVAESVGVEKSFPAQLVNCVSDTAHLKLEILATTGWTTTDLIKALNSGTKRTSYDLVTLLIGVNNQFQRRAFSIYEEEFSNLLEQSIALVNNNKNKVIVVSIPDYAYTPYGQNLNTERTSKEIDKYNVYAENTSKARGVKFINITDITRRGIIDPDLVAKDGLHPSQKAYKQFVEKICPVATSILK